MKDGVLLTAKEVSVLLKLSEQTIFKYAKTGKIPAHRIGAGSRIRFKPEEIEGCLTKINSTKQSITHGE